MTFLVAVLIILEQICGVILQGTILLLLETQNSSEPPLLLDAFQIMEVMLRPGLPLVPETVTRLTLSRDVDEGNRLSLSLSLI